MALQSEGLELTTVPSTLPGMPRYTDKPWIVTSAAYWQREKEVRFTVCPPGVDHRSLSTFVHQVVIDCSKVNVNLATAVGFSSLFDLRTDYTNDDNKYDKSSVSIDDLQEYAFCRFLTGQLAKRTQGFQSDMWLHGTSLDSCLMRFEVTLMTTHVIQFKWLPYVMKQPIPPLWTLCGLLRGWIPSGMLQVSYGTVWLPTDPTEGRIKFRQQVIPPLVKTSDLVYIRNMFKSKDSFIVYRRGCSETENQMLLYETVSDSSDYLALYNKILVRLLCASPEANTVQAPSYLVCYRDDEWKKNPMKPDPAFDGTGSVLRRPICGCLTPIFEGRSLERTMTRYGSGLPLCLRLKWSIQLAEATHHIYRCALRMGKPSFCSGLDPDNILITKSGSDLILVNLEQMVSMVDNTSSKHVEKKDVDETLAEATEHKLSLGPEGRDPMKLHQNERGEAAVVKCLGTIINMIMSKGQDKINASPSVHIKSVRALYSPFITVFLASIIDDKPKNRPSLREVIQTLHKMEHKT